MPNITHICISDLHAGALTSLLTPLRDPKLWTGRADGTPDCADDPTALTATTRTFADAFRSTVRSLNAMPAQGHAQSPATMILLGDGLDLSLSPPDRCFPVLKGFLKAVWSADPAVSEVPVLASRMILVPGNHDHALWTEQRFDNERFPDDGFSHVSPAFAPTSQAPQSRVLNTYLADIGITSALYYPNYGISTVNTSKDTENNRDKSIVFHHGHFIEPMYRLMSDIQAVLSGKAIPQTCDHLEMFNGPWIDFGWSTIGDAGPLGREAASVYQLLLTGSAVAGLERRIAGLVNRWVDANSGIAKIGMAGQAIDLLIRGIVDQVIGKFSQLERYNYTQPLSQSSIDGLKRYLAEAVAAQMVTELGAGATDMETAVVFGHTHKPFEDQLVVDGFSRPVSVCNTGGWILDTSLLSTVEAASLVFVDDELNTATLRLFSPPVNGVRSPVAVTSADPTPPQDNPAVTALRHAVSTNQTAWDAFSRAVEDDYALRQQLVLWLAEYADEQAKKTGGVL
ncbi:MAG: hypothetical protein KDC18_06095 [Alphaproteobacteria bacterium]|nr:hypothetical protein [Alphaproteobacteria bacterium]MCB9929211.1 hypothetical protein [Alphaproteobacteria bacterium]